MPFRYFKVHVLFGVFSWHCLATLVASKIDWRVYKPSPCVNDDNFSREFSEPIIIYSRLVITDVYDINEEKMEFVMQLYLTETWSDPLINLKDINLTKAEVLPHHVQKCIFQPDTIFPNCKTVELYEQTLPNLVVKVVPGNSLYRYARYKLVVNCPMDFYRYPMDQQKCDLQIALLSSRSDTADLRWLGEKPQKERSRLMKNHPNIQVYDQVKPLQYTMKYPTSSSKTFQYTSGNSTILICSMVFNRPLASSILNTFIPSFLVVCLSFLSFWLDIRAVPGRVTLGVTALLTLATQIVHARSSLPSLDYMTAIDIWLFGCLIMVFSALMEFTIAQAWSRRNTGNKIDNCEMKTPWNLQEGVDNEFKCCFETRKLILGLINALEEKTIIKARESTRPSNETLSSNIKDKGLLVPKNKTLDKTKKKDNVFDRFSRYFFPMSLVTFTVLYWSHYLK